MANSIVDDETEAGGADPLALARFLPYRLSILAESVSRAFAQHYERRFGLTIPEWRLMAVLGENSPQSTQDVIERTRMDRAKVSRAAIRLEDKGLIARAPLPGDQRAHRLQLSLRGLAMYRQIVPMAYALQTELVQSLGEDELRAFDAVLDGLQACADQLAPASDTVPVPP